MAGISATNTNGGAPLRLVVLGSTGSIGQNTLDLIARTPERFDVVALVGNRNVERLAAQARMVGARRAVVADASCYDALKAALAGSGIAASAGQAAVMEAAVMPADMVVAAIVGAAGLAPTLAAVRAGRVIALANKECLVCAGDLVMREARKHNARILPVDSEHNAIFQVFERDNTAAIEKVILTASGGPFRGWSREAMAKAGPEQALRHPNWEMGARISIDSATLMNKGLEVIEAFHLFPIERRQLDVLVHPQSAVHGLVQYSDGSLLAQLGAPDMRTPIAYCLSWPERMPAPSDRLDLAALQSLTFERPDTELFPALDLAWGALERGAGATAVLNGADEVAVAAFLDKRIGFLAIADVVAETLERADAGGVLSEPADLEEALELDAAARRLAAQSIETICAARQYV